MIHQAGIHLFPLPGFMVVDDLRVPPRSPLASIPPIGRGTSEAESLASYFMRISDQHSLTPHKIAKEYIWPLVGYESNSNADDYWQCPAFNGPGLAPRKWANALSALTSVQELDRLTLVPLAGLVPFKELAHQVRKWCPLCLAADMTASSEGIPYGRLLWNIKQVEACRIHGVKLVSACGCTRRDALSRWHRKFLPHLCWSCGRSLARDACLAGLERATSLELDHATLIAELLECDVFQPGSRERPASNIIAFLEEAIRSNGTAAAVGRLSGIGKSHLCNWVKGRNNPTMDAAVRLALGCSASLEEVLVGKPSAPAKTPMEAEHRKTKTRSVRSKMPYQGNRARQEAAKKALEAALKDEPPPRLSAVALQAGIQPRMLRLMYPDLVLAVTGRHRAWSLRETAKRRFQKEGIIRSVAEQLALEGEVPTFSRIEKVLGKDLSLFGNELRLLCNRVCIETCSIFGLELPA